MKKSTNCEIFVKSLDHSDFEAPVRFFSLLLNDDEGRF